MKTLPETVLLITVTILIARLIYLLLYLEDVGEGLPGQLVVDDGEEFAERPEEGGRLHALSQQILHGGQDVDFHLLKQNTRSEVIKGATWR